MDKSMSVNDLINRAYRMSDSGAHRYEVAQAFEDAAKAMQDAGMDGWGYMRETAEKIRARKQ